MHFRQLLGDGADAKRARGVEEVAALAVERKDVEDDRDGGADDRARVAARMRHGGVAPLREDRVVVLNHAEPRDLGRDELLEEAERQDLAAMQDVAIFDDDVAQDLADAVDDLLRPRADRGDGVDLPWLFALARELHDVVAGRADDVPAAPLQLVGDAEVEVDGKVAGEGDGGAGANVAEDAVEELAVRGD